MKVSIEISRNDYVKLCDGECVSGMVKLKEGTEFDVDEKSDSDSAVDGVFRAESRNASFVYKFLFGVTLVSFLCSALLLCIHEWDCLMKILLMLFGMLFLVGANHCWGMLDERNFTKRWLRMVTKG